MTRLSTRTACAVGGLGLGALLLSGCSSSSGSAPAASSTGSAARAASGAAAFTAYRDCLSRHGVTLPSMRARPSGAPRPSGFPSGRPSGRPSGGFGGGFGGFGGPGASADPTMAAAMQACASLRPQGGFGGGGTIGSTALAAFTSCMKDHGVTLPANTRLRAVNTADPTTAKAYAICKALLPSRPAASPSASASPSA